MKRNSLREFRLDHVLQRFVGNNLLSDVVSFNTVHKMFFYFSMARQREAIHNKMPKPKFGLVLWVVDSKSKLSRFVYITSHVTLQVQSNTENVNSFLQL